MAPFIAMERLGMNLKLIDAAIAAYSNEIDAKDLARLEFFRRIWGVQAEVAEGLDGSWAAPGIQRVIELANDGIALLREAPAQVDEERFGDAIARIVGILADEGIVPAESRERFADAPWREIAALSNVRLAGSDPARYLESLSDTLSERGFAEEDAHLGALAASLALKPFLEAASAGAQRALKDASADRMHSLTCPVCGSAPSVGKVGGAAAKGRHRTLWCPQCGAEWAFERVRCARCGTTHQGSIHFHNIEGDDAHRISSCDECGGYLRVVYVDEEEFLAPFSFEVEDVLMARLDAIAVDPTFAGGSQSHGEPSAEDADR